MKDLFWGGLLIAIGLVMGQSIFLGDFGLFNLAFDALGTYWVVKGGVSLARSKKAGPADRPPAGVHPSWTAAAKSILTQMREQYATPQTLEPAEPRKYDHLQLQRYAMFHAAMEARGFTFLGDYQIPEWNNSPTTMLAPTMIRGMASHDGAILAGYFQVLPRMARRLKMLAIGLLNFRLIAAPRDFARNLGMNELVDLTTEFDDGSFLVTSNAVPAALIAPPPSVECRFHASKTPLPDLMADHTRRLDEIRREPQGRKPVPVRTAEDLLRLEKRLRALKMEHRASVQWVTQEELRAFASGDTKQADAIYAEVQRLLAAERG
jgi:hypothetical protein